MDKTFNYQEKEQEIYKAWLENGCFKPLSDKKETSAKPYTIIMPPPNVTGQLHMGHALNNTTQDFDIRYRRMNGFNTLWVPGTDHASIATEVKVIEKLKSEGISKESLGREGFLKHAWAWKEQYGNRIVEQLKKLGCSCDWDRLAFTMDEDRAKSVLVMFKKLYDDKLIYQGNKIANWCPCCKTALSDAEVEHEEENGSLWHIRYPFVDDESKYLVLATTRPETLFGDQAVAVNPSDERYKDIVGKMLKLPLTNKTIPIIADEYVEKDFGTGVVKITPAHDANDFEVGLRHNLQVLKVFNDDGTLNELCGEKYANLDRDTAREIVVNNLKTSNLLEKIEDYKVSKGRCYRCGTVIEPIISKQWFVKMESLAKPAIDAVLNGELKITPKRVEKIYLNWLYNIKDWCISRQLWWGHRIPAYYCDNCGEIVVDIDSPKTCPKCGHNHFHQDEDVLDTWFSSALWPFSTLGWPNETEDLNKFFPTSTLITGQDIIFFWVARMVMMSKYATGKIPFSNVVINGIVRDDQNRKMSKSLGNGVDPLELIADFGTDALRFSLLFGNGTGNDIRFSREKLEDDRKFINKVWNASKFVEVCKDQAKLVEIDHNKFNEIEKWIIHKFDLAIKDVAKQFETHDYCLAVKTMFDFVWDDFCDYYIEMIKPYVYNENQDIRNHATSVLIMLLKELLKMLHPVIPFITEEIYSNFGIGLLMDQNYANVPNKDEYKVDFENVEKLKNLIQKTREFRKEMGVPISKKVKLVVAENKLDINNLKLVKSTEAVICKTANIESIVWVDSEPENSVSYICELGQFYMFKNDVFDAEKEILKLKKELEKLNADIEVLQVKLANPNFVEKAPANVVNAERERYEKSIALKTTIEEKLKQF